MRHRMAVATLALVGLLVSIYLLLYKLGWTGPLVCGSGGGCERVQASRWAVFLGVPVAAYGVGGYLALLSIALLGLRERWLARPGPTRWLAFLSGVGCVFALYLTYLEIFVIRSICGWCVASAVIVGAILAVSLGGLRRPSSLSPALRTGS